MDKVLEGTLSHFDVPDILTFLNMGKRSGALVLEREDQESKLFFNDGDPVFAASTRPDLRLGTLLVRMGKVTDEALGQALERHRDAGHRIGQALLAEKILSEQELASFLKVQVSEVIFDTFAWREGLFTFWHGVPAPATAVTLKMDLPNLLMEGSRRVDERGRLKELFPDLEMAVESVANPERVKQSVTLTPEEWKVFFLVDGRRTVADLIRLSDNPDEMATLEVLRHLVVAKFVAVVPAAARPPRTEPTPPPPGSPRAEPPPAASAPPPSAAPPPAAAAVEFNPPAGGARRKLPEDDTKEIVTPKAVQYLDAGKVTVSRLVLLGRAEGTEETSFPLTRDTYAIGRHRNNDIVVGDPKVSSYHARIERTAEGFVVVDLKSRNGVYLNGKKVDKAVLKTGDELRLGTAHLRYVVDFVQ